MVLSKTLIAALAATITVALSPLPELSAAPFGSPSLSHPSSDLLSVHAKKKAKKKTGKRTKAKGKKAAKATQTASCGTFKYRKGGKCVDARDKK